MTTPDIPTITTLARAFMESRVLLTAAELDLFTRLAGRALTASQVAEQVDGDLRGVTTLLDAVAGMGLLDKQDGAYRTPVALAPALCSDSPASILPSLLHAANLWERWSHLTARVKGEALPAAARRRDTAAFIGAMHVGAAQQADRLVAAIGVGGARRLLDVGGGPGTYTAAFLRAEPALSATLFDLPDVVYMARTRLNAAGLADRVAFAGGHMLDDALPGGHDLAFLSAIIHMFSAEENLRLYRRVHAALVAGGRLVIRDHVMADDHTRPRSGALFAVNMLVGTAGGGCYSFAEIADGLHAAGFSRVRLLQEGEAMDGLVEAFRD
jgi:3-hydroxy-5-methyl-1-naphthoate 3-O-methyltransferase